MVHVLMLVILFIDFTQQQHHHHNTSTGATGSVKRVNSSNVNRSIFENESSVLSSIRSQRDLYMFFSLLLLGVHLIIIMFHTQRFSLDRQYSNAFTITSLALLIVGEVFLFATIVAIASGLTAYDSICVLSYTLSFLSLTSAYSFHLPILVNSISDMSVLASTCIQSIALLLFFIIYIIILVKQKNPDNSINQVERKQLEVNITDINIDMSLR